MGRMVAELAALWEDDRCSSLMLAVHHARGLYATSSD